VSISALRHRVSLCTQQDIVTADGGLRLPRAHVTTVWAAIEQRRTNSFGPNGAVSYVQDRNKYTHRIYIRRNPELLVTHTAWLYEARTKSAPRWFKVLDVGETDSLWSPLILNQRRASYMPLFRFDCMLVERGDDLQEPEEPATLGAARPQVLP